MEKRTCKQCGRTLSINRFPYIGNTKKYRYHMCKSCRSTYNNNYHKIYYKEQIESKLKVIHNLFESNCGGWKIYILKHHKQGEFKFNLVSTTGEKYQTNDFDEFLSVLSELKCKF